MQKISKGCVSHFLQKMIAEGEVKNEVLKESWKGWVLCECKVTRDLKSSIP